MAKILEVKMKDCAVLLVEARDNDTPEAWRKDAGYQSTAGLLVLIDGTSYPKEDIASVTEHKPRKGFTNMKGI